MTLNCLHSITLFAMSSHRNETITWFEFISLGGYIEIHNGIDNPIYPMRSKEFIECVQNFSGEMQLRYALRKIYEYFYWKVNFKQESTSAYDRNGKPIEELIVTRKIYPENQLVMAYDSDNNVIVHCKSSAYVEWLK